MSAMPEDHGDDHGDNVRSPDDIKELAALARHIILTYPDFYKLFGER